MLESAAIGVKDEKWGERPLLFVVLKPEHKGKVDSRGPASSSWRNSPNRASCRDTRCRNASSSSTPSPRRASASWTRRCCAKHA
ncbi:MAG: hypothetical protein MZV70_71455 [Desulfobacterales bacterium]|nr:hypothetical protein [Desulfobacterales bacterium]